MDTLANALNSMKVAETKGRSSSRVKPTSRLIKEVLQVLQDNGYITGCEYQTDAQGGFFTVTLNGKINDCGTIKPRFSVTALTWEKFEQRFLPSKDTGILIVSTPQGVMTHLQAKEKKTGGRLIAYTY
ncbi:30S ribosomal protein S8 [Candidatus Micrarchaeota archaeon]|nr:30S ribosomal protein S8 [Candidatus Micrarchaeota archaeon]